MISLDELREMPEAGRLKKALIFTSAVWGAALIALLFALSSLNANSERLTEAQHILDAAVTVRSYPKQAAASGAEPLTAVSAILDKLGLQTKVAQLASSPAGLMLQLNRLYPADTARLAEELQNAGLSVKTAEIRSLAGKEDGRLLNVTLTLEGGAQ